MAITANITDDCYTGEDKTLTFTIYTDDTATTPKDITGYTFKWELRKFKDSPTAVVTKSTGSGITILVAANGTLNVTVDKADWLTFEPGTYYHQLERTNSGAATVESEGTFVLKRGQR